MQLNTEAQIVDYFLKQDLDAESRTYIQTHAMRFAYLLNYIGAVRKTMSADRIRIMDIGPSFFTELLKINFPGDEICTLGFKHEAARGGHLPEGVNDDSDHYTFDLNDAQYPEKWIEVPKSDLIIMAEVLEHLYTSPIRVYGFVNSFMNQGSRFIVGTPNAVTLVRRLKLMLGQNPYELIRTTRDNPGHFREYTLPELKALGKEAGLDTVSAEIKNYFKPFSAKGKLFDAFVKYCLPASFNTGISITYAQAKVSS